MNFTNEHLQGLPAELQITAKLAEVKQFPFLTWGQPNLGTVMNSIGRALREDIRFAKTSEYSNFPEKLATPRDHVIFIAGSPNSGKSSVIQGVGDTPGILHFLKTQQRFAERTYNTPQFVPRIIHVNRAAIEKKLNEEGIITSTPGDLSTYTELTAVNKAIEKEIARLLKPGKSRRPRIIIVDGPGATEGFDQGSHDITLRNYGWGPLINNLLGTNGAFEGMDRKKYTVTTIGLAGGSWFEVFKYYRSAIQQARNLEEAQQYNEIFGMKPFDNSTQWHTAQHGAGLALVRRIQSASKAMVTFYKVQQRLSLLPPEIMQPIQDPAHPVFPSSTDTFIRKLLHQTKEVAEVLRSRPEYVWQQLCYNIAAAIPLGEIMRTNTIGQPEGPDFGGIFGVLPSPGAMDTERVRELIHTLR